MEKWARKLQLIINKRDTLLSQLNKLTEKYYNYSTISHLSINDFKDIDTKIIFSQLSNAIKEYNTALAERDQLMFGKFLDSLIHEKKPTKESQNWCAFQY
ncbi:hypothetical protein [Saccharicrinis aurantiacus]|uniref:hypothetical protein n=1 Tax=Saccharicrinis aurantiacus TaxID=1849719 RepID=UPI00094FBC2F|nr:hypothetical protein [Saccharicrinis aurantiacus]